MKNRNQLFVTALIFVFVGFGLGFWYGSSSDISITKTPEGCFEISVDSGSKTTFVVEQQNGEKTELGGGDSEEFCGQFKVYESIPIPWD